MLFSFSKLYYLWIKEFANMHNYNKFSIIIARRPSFPLRCSHFYSMNLNFILQEHQEELLILALSISAPNQISTFHEFQVESLVWRALLTKRSKDLSFVKSMWPRLVKNFRIRFFYPNSEMKRKKEKQRNKEKDCLKTRMNA